MLLLLLRRLPLPSPLPRLARCLSPPTLPWLLLLLLLGQRSLRGGTLLSICCLRCLLLMLLGCSLLLRALLRSDLRLLLRLLLLDALAHRHTAISRLHRSLCTSLCVSKKKTVLRHRWWIGGGGDL